MKIMDLIKKFYPIVIAIVLFLLPNYTHAERTFAKEEAVAQNILKRLYNSYGNFVYPMPPLEIVDEKKRVAAFIPNGIQGKIILEKATYDLCKQFDEDFESALAFILGHELGHFFERGHDRAFANDYLQWPQGIQKEKGADVWGVFCAYLAGYKTIGIVPELLEAVYREYGLLGKDLYGYPSFKERQQIALEVTEKVEELIEVFDTANYLTAIGQYDLAVSSYLYIEQYYQGREIYNNLGVNYTLQAINFTKVNVDKYLYPLEIDTESRIKKPQISRGDTLTEEEKKRRKELLQQAQKYLEIAGKIDYNYFSDDINMMVVLTLLMDDCATCEQPLDYYKYHELSKTSRIIPVTENQKANLKLILAIAKMKSGQEDEATRIWTRLLKHSNEQIRYQAQYNLKMAATTAVETNTEEICPSINIDFPADGIRLHRVNYKEGPILNASSNHALEIRKMPNTYLYIFQKGNDDAQFSLQVNKKLKKSVSSYLQLEADNQAYQLISTTKGAYIICRETRNVWMIDQNGNIVEHAKYYLRTKS